MTAHDASWENVARLVNLLLAAPALLTTGLAAIMPSERYACLAMALLAASVLTLASPWWRPWRHLGNLQPVFLDTFELALLLLAIACVVLLLPIPAGLLLLAGVRMVLTAFRGPLPGFPFMDAALLLGAALAIS